MARLVFCGALAALVSTWSFGAVAQEAVDPPAEGSPAGENADATPEAPAATGTETAPPIMVPAETQPVAAQPATAAQNPSPAAEPALEGGVRFRFGVSAGGGPMVWDGPTLSYGGADVRLGVQINQLIGVYVQPQLGFYSGNFNGVTGIGGIIGVSGGVDFTFFDHLFVGVGGGYAVLNNPSGPEVHFRLGGYPLVSGGDVRARRKGLMVGVDIRMHFLDGATFFAPTFAIGYEAF